MASDRPPSPADARARIDRACRAILAAGFLLRIVTFAMMRFYNADNHLEVIDFLAKHGRLATTPELTQGYHPPLYYLIAVWPWIWFSHAKVVQGLSLVFSLATLWTLDRLLADRRLLSPRWRPWCLSLAAFHPEFIIYSLFLSNDGLAILIGALFMLAMKCAQERSERKEPGGAALVAVVLGLGLLTKGTFLAFLPLAAIFLFSLDSASKPAGRRLATAAGWICFAIAVGSYKYVENALLLHNPFASNLDMKFIWVAKQKGTWLGWRSLDINLFKLVADPKSSEWSRHVPPVLLYATFWYMHLPEPTFFGNRILLRDYTGSLVYVAALIPTFLILAGIARGAAGKGMPFLRRICIATIVMNLALVVSAGMHHDVWSVFVGRLLYPAYGGALIALGSGLDALRRSRLSRRWIGLALADLGWLDLLFLFYTGIEIVFYVYMKTAILPGSTGD